MKKAGVLIIAILLLSSIVIAQSNLSGNSSTFTPLEATDNALETQIDLPEWLQISAKILFGIAGEEVTIVDLIVYAMLFLIMFLFMMGILKTFPYFPGKTKIIAAFAITLLIAISRVIKILADFFLGFRNSFESNGTLNSLIIFFIVVFSIYFIISKVLTTIERRNRIEKAKETGTKVGAAAKALSNVAEKLGE